MNDDYAEYCLADPVFYDDYTVTRGDDVDFAAAARLPEGWVESTTGDWLMWWPEGADVPPQGWKVHVSACLDNADRVLDTVLAYCTPRRIPFKFVRSAQCLLLRNAKHANRAASGKFVTIYPSGEKQLETIVAELGSLLEGEPGPYILSDLRCGEGPLYVRYGGFADRWCPGPDGAVVPAIEDAAGVLVPDHRGPTFSPPDWVTLPAFLEPHLAARAAATIAELPYDIDEALHFSNGGGCYAGTVRGTGERVVLKEARPHAGLDGGRNDAVTRLGREEEVLGRLAGLDVVPAVRDAFTLAGHRFLVLERIEGRSLSDEIVARYPLLTHETDPAALASYTEWALAAAGAVEAAVAAVHGRGVAIGDLHPNNLLLRPDGSVALVDFEVATGVDDTRPLTLGDPGFAPPAGCTAAAGDRYALACLRLHLFLPLTNMFALDRAKARHVAAEAARLFPVPDGWLEEAAATIAGDRPPMAPVWESLRADAGGWEEARDSMAAAILASATPQRDDRLFPGDIRQFRSGGLNLAYGAAGVLYALAVTGAGRYPDHEQWLIRRALDPQPGTAFGLYDGLHGVAHVLDLLGHRAEALKVLDICASQLAGRLDRMGLDLAGGLAGIGLNLAYFAAAHDEPALAELASSVATAVADRLGGPDDVPAVSGGNHPWAGLVRGSSGPALLFVHLYERTGDSALLDLAATALAQDLRRCVTRPDGSLQVDEGWRTMPYVADGSVGIGMVLERFLRHRPDERFAEAAAAIRRTAAGGFVIEPGLFYGRAGLLLHLAGDPADPRVVEHVHRLGWHAMPHGGHLAFPGEVLLRLSSDLASGTAGVLLALGAALQGGPIGLPFLSNNDGKEVNDTWHSSTFRA
ncbi:MAG TPA: class III lanthionine synthetase LanKC [Acidimicrobiales bacterium]|nr:class III lanthionine synthetase LanKC [Acidimicrobiales bacterium]